MKCRNSWLAGTAALLFGLVQLNSLLQPTVDGPPWQLFVVAGLVLGIVITWIGVSYGARAWVTAIVNAAALIVVIAQVAAPSTTWFLIPTQATATELRSHLDLALSTIHHGVEPVIPVVGLVVILMALLWTVGILLSWGLATSRPLVALVPPLIITLQFATMDRQHTSPVRSFLFLAVVTACLLAANFDRRRPTLGKMTTGYGLAPPRRFAGFAGVLLASTITAAVASVSIVGNAVPSEGIVMWRNPTGLTGDFQGSVAYNPFISIQQSLVAGSDAPIFAYRVEGGLPAEQIYFRLLTMEAYNGGQFFADRPQLVPAVEDPWLAEGHEFLGPTIEILTDVEILQLRMEWLPSAATPVKFASTNVVERTLGVRSDDAALRLQGGLTYKGLRYQVVSVVPQPDIQALATTIDGELSPAFKLAQGASEPVPTPQATEVREVPPDVDDFLGLPDDLGPAVGRLARQQTRNLATPFERGLALESWFRSEAFDYSTDIEAGHRASDLTSWLTDPNSPNYRIGYCENFATAMAVMARALDIPSRVVLGFAPGTLQADGSAVVRDRDAHAWVELWMPTQGWVQFDPTPLSDSTDSSTYGYVETALGFPITEYLNVPDPELVVRSAPARIPEIAPNEPVFVAAGGSEVVVDRGPAVPRWVWSLTPYLGALLLSFGAVPGFKLVRQRRRMSRLRSGDISAGWEQIVDDLRDSRRHVSAAHTPLEVAATVGHAMEPLAVVYTHSLFGAAEPTSTEAVLVATDSLKRTKSVLAKRQSGWARWRGRYSLGTIMPSWFNRLVRRRRSPTT